MADIDYKVRLEAQRLFGRIFRQNQRLVDVLQSHIRLVKILEHALYLAGDTSARPRCVAIRPSY